MIRVYLDHFSSQHRAIRRLALFAVILCLTIGSNGILGITPVKATTGEIAFVSNRDSGWDIYLMNADGTNVRKLTKDGHYKEKLSWSPDGTQIAFTSNWENNWEIYILDVATGSEKNITNNEANRGIDYDPAWSPDGTRIAFSSDRNGSLDIYVMSPDGSNVQQLTTSDFDDKEPSWSADSTAITFVSFREQFKERVYIMNADGTNTQRVSKGTDNFAPTFEPNGGRILFTAGSPTASAIWFLNVDGSKLRALTHNNGFNGYAVWSPDGDSIAFSSTRDGNGEIYTIQPDGSNQRNLTHNYAIDAYPAWKP